MTLRLLILFLMALLFNSSVKILNAFVLVKHWRRRSPGSQVALGLRLCSTAVPSLQGLPGDPQFDEAMMKLFGASRQLYPDPPAKMTGSCLGHLAGTAAL